MLFPTVMLDVLSHYVPRTVLDFCAFLYAFLLLAGSSALPFLNGERHAPSPTGAGLVGDPSTSVSPAWLSGFPSTACGGLLAAAAASSLNASNSSWRTSCPAGIVNTSPSNPGPQTRVSPSIAGTRVADSRNCSAGVLVILSGTT